MLAKWHWHIEISSKCTLACPRCARQEVPESLVNTELTLEFFLKNFTPDFIKSNVEKITFCGDDGDPIYAHDLIEVIKYFKFHKPTLSIIIVTNGSYKKTDWWHTLGKLLSYNDQIHFSIDGYDNESNNKYRVNSDYDSIISGINTLVRVSDVWLVWDAIGFKFNEDKIADMQRQAKDLGFDQFQLTKSTKFGKIYPSYGTFDILQPNEELISNTYRFERVITDLSGRKFKEHWLPINFKYYQNGKVINNEVKPMCFIGNKGLYINSKGDFFPCCWVANRYQHNNKWIDMGKKFNLYDNLLDDVLKDNIWNDDLFSNSIECKTKCHVDRVTEKYGTEW